MNLLLKSTDKGQVLLLSESFLTKGETMTFEDYGSLFGGDVRAIVAVGLIDGKLVVVLRFGVESEDLEPIARANVEAEMARFPFLHGDTLKQFFGDPEFEAAQPDVTTVNAEEEEKGGNGKEDIEYGLAAGFAVLVDGEVVYSFVCQLDVIRQDSADHESFGPYILGIKPEDRAADNPALAMAVRAACEWFAGGPTRPCYFLSDSLAKDQLTGLGVFGEKIEVQFEFEARVYAVLTFETFKHA
jgi:hypothetical protein